MRRFLTGLAEIREGGSYQRFLRMVKALGENELSIYVYSTSPDPIRSKYVVWKYVLKHMPPPAKRILFFLLFPFIVFRHAVLGSTKNIIVFGPVYACFLLPLKLIRGCSVICMVRGILSEEYSLQKRSRGLVHLVASIEQIGFFSSDRIVTVSETFKTKLQSRFHVPPRKLVCLPNEIPDLKGEDIDVEHGVKIWERKTGNQGLRLFTGGIITPGKSYETIFQALSFLHAPFHLCIAGKPTYKLDHAYFGQLKRLAADLELENKLTWLGWLNRGKLLGVLAASHLFISASRHEGMSNILLEALALDVPCLAKDTPESLELIGSKELLFETPEDLAKLLQKFYSEESFAETVAEACKRAREKWTFNWENRLVAILTEDGFDA